MESRTPREMDWSCLSRAAPARASAAGIRRNRLTPLWRSLLPARPAIWQLSGRGLFTGYREPLNLLVRAKSDQEARERLWQSLQLHLGFPEFFEYLNSRITIFRGELTSERFGFIATMSIIRWSNDEFADSLRGFAESQVREAVHEREFARRTGSDSVGAARTGASWRAALFARFDGCGGGEAAERSCEGRRGDRLVSVRLRSLRAHQEIWRAYGASTFARRAAHDFSSGDRDGRQPSAETSQFDMVQAFDTLARLPVLPLRPDDGSTLFPRTMWAARL